MERRLNREGQCDGENDEAGQVLPGHVQEHQSGVDFPDEECAQDLPRRFDDLIHAPCFPPGRK